MLFSLYIWHCLTILQSPNDTSTLDFASLVRGALLRELTHKATCQSCKRFSTFTSHRTIHSRELPPLLAVNTAVHDEETLRPWLDVRRQRFLTPQVELRGDLDGVDGRAQARAPGRNLDVARSRPGRPQDDGAGRNGRRGDGSRSRVKSREGFRSIVHKLLSESRNGRPPGGLARGRFARAHALLSRGRNGLR